ncbi:hypothetical protein B0H63DRAFT_239970 [Podospora didyma]|uniref:Ams2/SPT21 N-terminal domain-containing protein n=1 Tax=Podospora didyma TaxID=330526 RepID=A0AAE0NCD3_9PEZI|nr:hypothetical protein B0H63DRAFT_239970 [Podospora didyma]
MATPTNSWSAPPHPSSQPSGGREDLGLPARPMGLKVHYSFDRDNVVNCMARWPHILNIQTAPIDDRNTIGVVDLRTCLQAVAQCSPEIINQQDIDYSVYAYDVSEADMPLVGQGMLSWGLDQNNDQHQQKQQQQQQQQIVTGRVTRNLLALMSNGSRETLEVRLKLTAVPKMQQRSEHSSMDGLNLMKAPTPTDAASEWNSFIQSNPLLGHSGNVAAMPSPALPPTQMNHFNSSMGENRFMDMRTESVPPPSHRPPSIPPLNMMQSSSTTQSTMASAPAAPQATSTPFPPRDNAQSPVPQQPEIGAEKPRPSRPTSRARVRNPTGRPRGRPRKKPLETGNTSATEEATDGDEGPQKKRAKITKAEYSAIAPFGSAPDSLRVAASTSGSLRNMRPVGAGGDGPVLNRLQDIPRAPTPIPDGPLMHKQIKRRAPENLSRSDPMTEMDSAPIYQSRANQSALSRSMSQDAQSPAESIAQSPDQAYTPEDSPADLGSSPPVPRTSAYMHSSPLASSPVLPTMPLSQVDSGFMSGGIDDLFDDDDLMRDFPQAQMQDLPQQLQPQMAALPASAPASKPNSRKNSRAPQPQQPTNFPFQEVNPGPPELLPTTSIFNPAGRAKTLNRPPPAASVPPVPKKAVNRPLKRSNTAPNPVVSEPRTQPLERPPSQQHMVQQEHDISESHLSQLLAQIQPQEQSRDHMQSNSGLAVQHTPIQDASNDGTEVTHPTPALEEPNDILPTITPAPEHSAEDNTASFPTQPVSRPVSRGLAPASIIPASDPVQEPTMSQYRPFMSEAPCPFSDADPGRYNKNQVKKYAIKERLINAIEKGESPPFCNNCGAIETPTWRKIWTQEHQGVPGFHEFSDKPGYVTTIDVIERDPEGKPTLYRLVKKNLGSRDDKKLWTEALLCNPCGIWLAKFKSHRPSDRWDKDAARLNQPRKKRGEKNNGRSKKGRTKSDAQMNPTSEAYFTTDPIGPVDPESPKANILETGRQSRQRSEAAQDDNNEQTQSLECMILNSRGSQRKRLLGSTHSRGSGTADSPIAVEDDLGTTRRLLFPSPRKDGVLKVLGELAVNVVQTNPNLQGPKSAGAGKENARSELKRPGTPVLDAQDDLEQELFGTPPDRPSTPPPKAANSGIFKTPTRPTPSHRPITRSISRSIRTVRPTPISPGHSFGHVQRTPCKTPRSSGSNATVMLSTSKRRSPRNAHLHAHFALDDMHNVHFDSPFTATLNQLLSEANEFTAGSPSHGLLDLDISSLPALDSDDIHHLNNASGALDFGNYLSTDLVMPSSPPMLRNHGSLSFGASLTGFSTANADHIWAEFTASEMNKGGMNGLDDSAEP